MADIKNSPQHYIEGALQAVGQTDLPPVAVTGSKGSGAALTSLLAGLVKLGLITDGTVA